MVTWIVQYIYIFTRHFPSNSTTIQWYVLKLAVLMFIEIFYSPRTHLGKYTYHRASLVAR